MTAALLGVQARLVTAVGVAGLGAVVRSDCADHGVDLVDVAPADYAVPVSTVLVTASTGERAVASRNAADATGWPVPDDDVLAAALDGVTAVLVDGHHLPVGVAVAAAAQAAGIPVLLDAGSWKPGLEALVAHVDVLVASADFRSPAGDSLPELLALGPSWVSRSAGGEPVTWLAADGSSGEVPVPVVDVVDTLGAGDVLHGAFLAAIGERGTTDLPAALAFAVGVAARSVAAPGARGWARPTP